QEDPSRAAQDYGLHFPSSGRGWARFPQLRFDLLRASRSSRPPEPRFRLRLQSELREWLLSLFLLHRVLLPGFVAKLKVRDPVERSAGFGVTRRTKSGLRFSTSSRTWPSGSRISTLWRVFEACALSQVSPDETKRTPEMHSSSTMRGKLLVRRIV